MEQEAVCRCGGDAYRGRLQGEVARANGENVGTHNPTRNNGDLLYFLAVSIVVVSNPPSPLSCDQGVHDVDGCSPPLLLSGYFVFPSPREIERVAVLGEERLLLTHDLRLPPQSPDAYEDEKSPPRCAVMCYVHLVWPTRLFYSSSAQYFPLLFCKRLSTPGLLAHDGTARVGNVSHNHSASRIQ